MKLGIVINTNRHLDHVMGITKAAVSKGHEVSIFIMDEGTKLLGYAEFCSLCKLQGVQMNFCRLSAEKMGVGMKVLPVEIADGSQYNNAIMNHYADKVIVL